MRTAKEIRIEAKQRHNNYQQTNDWDVPDLVAELEAVRARRLPILQKWVKRLTKKLQKLVKKSILSGAHWKQIEDPFTHPKSSIKLRHELKIRKVDIDLPQYDDYPVIDIHFDYDEQYVNPYFDLNSLATLLEADSARITMNSKCHGPIIVFVGKFENEFCHLILHLNGVA
jgi:hypothetical protein